MSATWHTIGTRDGRELEVITQGRDGGMPLIYHSGTPTAAVEFRMLAEPAAALGWQLVRASRPGYAGSLRREGRSVADVVEDTRTILDYLGQYRFVTLGWSGGGPHALATAALMPDRCAAAAILASLAPFDAVGLDWYAGMAPDNVEEFSAAAESSRALTSFLETQATALATVKGEQVAEVLGQLVDEIDRAALTGEVADYVAEDFRRGVSNGVAGWRDDDLAFVRPWGFDLSDIKVRISVWQGAHDRMVPFEHGRWLAAHIPGARVNLHHDEGHLSLVAQLPRILDDLHDLASL
jgi:pimeloyl-ACP methyl ester carboxylesterase